jgi:intein/homing endonuclease
MCVCGETMILTRGGYSKIKSFENKYVQIWNGSDWIIALIKKDDRKNLIRVNLSNGIYLDCTSDHKFLVKEVSPIDILFPNGSQKYVEVTANNLNQDDILIDLSLPDSINTSNSIIDTIKIICNMFGTVTKDEIEIRHMDKEFLINIRLSLQTLGINSEIKQFNLIMYKLIVFKSDLHKLVKYGINTTDKQLKSNNQIRVISIVESYKNVDSYSVIVESELFIPKGIFNGILTNI